MIASCPTCRQDLHDGNSYTYGAKRRCKACAREQATAWQHYNRERARANNAAWRAKQNGGGPPGPHNRDRTRCVHGHAFDAANTYRYRDRRFCRKCLAAKARRQYRRRKEQANAGRES